MGFEEGKLSNMGDPIPVNQLYEIFLHTFLGYLDMGFLSCKITLGNGSGAKSHIVFSNDFGDIRGPFSNNFGTVFEDFRIPENSRKQH